VIDMALLSVIRRRYFREHLSIREISRGTGLSRGTVSKYLRSDDIEPRFKVPERPSKLDPFADRLSAWLKSEAGKPRKQRRTLKQLHADLIGRHRQVNRPEVERRLDGRHANRPCPSIAAIAFRRK
jgi:transcriptional regulator with XRE-family HTH domain